MDNHLPLPVLSLCKPEKEMELEITDFFLTDLLIFNKNCIQAEEQFTCTGGKFDQGELVKYG